MHSVKHNITRSTLRLVVLVLASFIALSCCGGGNSTGILPAQTKTATCAVLPWCANLTPGTWYEVPNSHMSSVGYTCTNTSGCNSGATPPSVSNQANYSGVMQDIHGVEGTSAVMNDWSSGALDTNRDRLYVTGGGHFGYYGNEVYSFDLRTLTWSLIKQPDILAYGWYCPDPTVAPCSAHYYGSIQFSPISDVLILPGHHNHHWHTPPDASTEYEAIYPNEHTAGNGVYLLGSLDTTPTYSLGDAYVPSSPNGEVVNSGTGYETYEGAVSGFDPTTNLYWLATAGPGRLSSFNPATGHWTYYGGYVVGNGYQYESYIQDGSCIGAVDPVDHLFVAIGGTGSSNPCLPAVSVPTASNIAVWDISAASQAVGHIKATAAFSTGPNDAEHSHIGTIEWDSAINRFVAWIGGSNVYLLDPTTWTWTLYAPGGDVPPAPTTAGEFNRFRYDPNLDVFVLANRTTDDVYILKLDNTANTHSGCVTPVVTNTSLTLTTDSYKKVNYQITASNTPTYFWGNGLPEGYGVAVDPITGILSGTPTKAGIYHAIIGAQNACGTGPGTALTLTVSDTPHFHNGVNSYVTLQQAVNAATAGDAITADAGNYMDMYVDITKSLTIQSNGGSAVFGNDQLIPRATGRFDSTNATTYSKGMFLTEDETTTVLNGLEIYGARNGTGDGENAAAVRYQGGDFTLINSYIHNNQNGLLGGKYPTGKVHIINSVFDENGRCEPPNSCAHGAYIGEVAEATITNSTFTNTHIGHHIKSRAHKTTISNTIEDDGSSNPGASLEIDFPDGGENTVTCNVAIKNQYAGNDYLIEFGEEAGSNGLNPVNSLSITNSLFVNNYGPPLPGRHITGVFNKLAGMKAILDNNTFVRFDSGYQKGGAGTFTETYSTFTNADTNPLTSCGPIGANLSIQAK